MLSFFVTAGVLVGFDASGHVAEETKNASLTAARGVFYSALASGLMGFPMVILFLFCTPDLDTLYSWDSPQPFVNLYALALGQNAHIVMNVVAIVGLVLVTPSSILAGLMAEYVCGGDCCVETCICNCARWSFADVRMDLTCLRRRTTTERGKNYLGCWVIVALHHSRLSRRIYVSCFGGRSSHYHCVRFDCLYPPPSP